MHPAKRKSDGKSRLSADPCRWMALRTHNLPSERKKYNLGEVDKAMFQGVEMQCKNVFCILGIQERNLDDVA
jgi:hypothetical protein